MNKMTTSQQKQFQGIHSCCKLKHFSRLYKWLKKVFLLLLLLWGISSVMGHQALAGFRIQDGYLIDNNGSPFIMRGINLPHVWYPQKTTQAISDIAIMGANTVRLVLGNGEQWGPTPATEVTEIIKQLKKHKMIGILEIHDCTGYGEKAGAAAISTAVDYWLSIQDILKGEEDYVIINIANEPLGNNVATSTWANIHMQAINRLRNAGLTHTLMVDAANWGQDWEQIMLNDAPQVFSSDPLKNIVFSVHMYQVYNSYDTINDYISTFANQLKLPLVIGEFGADHQGEDVDESAIMEVAEEYDIGYLGWSWSGNSDETESMDIVINFDASNLSSWGETLIDEENGIRNTAETSTVFTKDDTIETNGDTDINNDTVNFSDFPGCGGTATSGCGQ